jgi:hypothetical protein
MKTDLKIKDLEAILRTARKELKKDQICLTDRVQIEIVQTNAMHGDRIRAGIHFTWAECGTKQIYTN